MKLIIFLIVVAIIYFIATRIKVTHLNKLAPNEKKEIENRNKIRNLILYNHVKTSDDMVNSNQTEQFSLSIDDSPNINELFSQIKDQFLDQKYYFNLSTQPVTSRYLGHNLSKKDKKYLKHIKNSILEWNQLLDKKLIKIKEIIPIFIKETEDEFVITVNVRISYHKKMLYLSLVYYGKNQRSDDFINHPQDTYVIQLIDLKVISKNDFYQKNRATENDAPFITMDEQLAYVNKIHQMHQNELE